MLAGGVPSGRVFQHPASRIKPLPCPFCGSEADAGRIGYSTRYGVTCTNGDCPVEAQATAGTYADAVAAWNGVRS